MDLGNHGEQDSLPLPISAQFSAAAIHETAAKLKLLAASGSNGSPITPSPPAVASLSIDQKPAITNEEVLAAAAAAAAGDTKGGKPVRYRECLKNHAANIGGHALDGCGEFMPCGEEGTVDSLRCAACDCHRNFHRREVEGEPTCVDCAQQRYNREKKRSQLLMTPGKEGGSEMMDDQGGYPGGSMSTGGLKKRFRTKFTGDQKERMLRFAEKLGWRIQKQDEGDVQQFCNEVGVKRHVLKVWMHNNKHTLAKKM